MSIPDEYLGEPGYPAPWTTTTPREGLRDTDQARIISLAPDVCRSPSVPVPYPVVDFCGHDESYTSTVRFTGQKAMVMRSRTSHVHGDEAGTGKGVVSGTVGGISEPIGHAAQVRAEGSPVIRHLDRFHMNNRNTVGEAVFVRDTRSYPAPEDDDPLPGSIRLADASGSWTQYAQGAAGGAAARLPQTAAPGSAPQGRAAPRPAPAPPPRPTPPAPRPPGQVIRPDIPQWRRPPPTSPTAGMSRWAKLGRVGRFGGPLSLLFLDMRSTPTIPYPGRDADPFERHLNQTARDLLDPFDAGHNDSVRDWYLRELEDYRQDRDAQRPAPMPAEEPESRSLPAPLSDNVRVDEDEDNARCKVQLICFMPVNPSVDHTEFRRQLKLQEGALNAMTPTEMLGNRGMYLADPEGMRKLSEPLQARTRAEYRESRLDEFERIHGPRAEMELDAHMRTVAALHNPDMIAGGSHISVGDPSIPLRDRIGGLNENSSMGSQWRGGRSQRLENHARQQQRNGCPSVQVVLEICIDGGR